MSIEVGFKTPTLYSVSSAGKLQEWTIFMRENPDGTATMIREHGFVGHKIQHIEKNVYKGKNIGKSNQTTPYEQALVEGLALRKKRMDTGWTEFKPNMDSYKAPELPMLAHPFDKRGHNISYPAFVQPKLNGVRCLAKKVSEDEIVFSSRQGKHYNTLDHLIPALLDGMEVGQILDGEIYIHGKTFQHIIRLVKKLRPESITLKYHVYDMATDAPLDFIDRSVMLKEQFSGLYPEIECVQTFSIYEEKEIYEYHDQFVKEGYEGIIIRNRNGHYKFKSRSANLQKYKKFFDDEFEIIGGKASTGLHEGCVVFKCSIPGSNETVDAYPRGTLEDRRKMFDNLDSYIGKKLTIRYQELSEDGVPIFPIGIVVRDYE